MYIEEDTLVDIEQVSFVNQDMDFSASNLDSCVLSQLGTLGKLMVGEAPSLTQLNAHQAGTLSRRNWLLNSLAPSFTKSNDLTE